MNRRSFISTLLGTAASAAVDPEKLLWVPGAKTISIPKAALGLKGRYAVVVLRDEIVVGYAGVHEFNKFSGIWMRNLSAGAQISRHK
jgi:hypothetical protein